MTKTETNTATQTTQHPNLFAALAVAQAEMGPALKQSNNSHFKAKYADLGNVMEACLPALNRNGIAVVQPIGQDETGPYVKTILLHASGERLDYCRCPLIVNKNDMQGFGSAVTYARRYGLMAMAGIAPEDDDGNAAVKSAPRPAMQEAESVADDMGVFVAAVSSACVTLEMCGDLDTLKRIFSGLRRDVQADASVIKAKDKRKAELSQIPIDEIPY
jgi:hypothetical protein